MVLLEGYPVLVFLCGFLLVYVISERLNLKPGLLSQMMGSEDSMTSFESNECSDTSQNQTIVELTERVIALEKIVTDSKYQLDQKLNQL